MSDYSRAARVYWSAMVTAGLITCGWAIYHCASFTPIQLAQFLALISLAIISSVHPIHIPATAATVTASDAFVFLGAIFLGIPAAIMIGATDAFVSTLRSSRRATSWLGAPAIISITTLFAGNIFYQSLSLYAHATRVPLGLAPVPLKQLLLPLVLMALVQYFINGVLLATLNALKSRRSPWRFWRDSYLWTSLTFFAAAIAAALVYAAIMDYGLLYVLLSVPVIGATYATYKIYFERVNQKTREAAEMSRIHLETVEALATAIDAKDQTTHCHVRRVQIYAAGLGRLFLLSDSEIEALKAGALLHDIGKLAVPDHILSKPGKLTAAEFEKMKIHTTIGAQILERIAFPYPVAPIVRHHHERWDGLGYPDALRGEEIPLTARILAVVDCFDSVREERPYRRGMTREEASALLRRGAGTHFDPQVVELFLRNLLRFETEIAAQGLDQHGFTSQECDSRALVEADASLVPGPMAGAAGFAPPTYLNQIRNAHREVFTLYETARTFGSSLEIENIVPLFVERVGQIVPFDTAAVYLYNELKNYATMAHVAGRNADLLRERCVAPGEGAVGFVLANRRPISQLDPMLDFADIALPVGSRYHSMAALPLIKDESLLGALAVYSLEPNRYTADHMRLLDTVARLASDALSNAMRHAEAESNALTDTLTGLANARALYLRLEEEAARASRLGRPFQVIMLDLDNFKEVNDTFGHQTGDQMLREAARLIQAQLREYDFLARYAGDEFVAIVQDLSSAQVVELCERIEQAVTRFSLRVRPGHYARVGISVGAAVYGAHGETLDQLLIAADEAMYSVKSGHKKRRRAEAKPDAGREDLATGNLASSAIN